MMLPLRAGLILACFAASACTEQVPPSFGESVPLSVPAGNNASGPRLAQDGEERVTLSWMERDEDSSAVRFTALELGKWQSARTVANDPDMFVNWADLPAVTPIGEQRLFAHWLSYRADAPYAYDVLTAQSADNGKTWSDPVRPHTDGTESEHGFVSVFRAGNGTGLLWLDGRKTINVIGDDPVTSGMTLRHATIDHNGVLQDEVELDDLVCDCCQPDVAISESGPVAVYRDRTAGELRDIYVTRMIAGQWQSGAPIANDGWQIDACPVNGPAIAANGDRIGVAWFTAANGKPVVQAAISKNSGKSFSDPIQIALKPPLGYVGIVAIDEHSFAVSWLESDRKGSFLINIRGITNDRNLGKVHTVGRTSISHTVPQMVRVGAKLIVAWTDEISESNKVASVEVPILGFYD